jgi:hypothetical protein
MRTGSLRRIYVDVGTKRYLLRGARERTQDTAAKNISDGRQTTSSTLYWLRRILTIVVYDETDVPASCGHLRRRNRHIRSFFFQLVGINVSGPP